MYSTASKPHLSVCVLVTLVQPTPPETEQNFEIKTLMLMFFSRSVSSLAAN